MMSVERPRMAVSGVIASVVILVGVAGLALGSLAVDRTSIATLERPASHAAKREQALARRLTEVDEALLHKDVSRAIHDWQSAYSLALGMRRSDAMLRIGDAALRIDALMSTSTGHPGRFRAAARQAYLSALFQARNERSQQGIDEAAQAFAAIGDTEMATRARAIQVAR
jgi:hypothetical protein